MKPHRNIVALRWPGLDSLKAARQAIDAGNEVEIELPVGTHYALYKELHREPLPAAEQLDVSGGAEILEPLAGIRGLEELAKLRAAVKRAHYRVHLVSPEPVLCLRPPLPGR